MWSTYNAYDGQSYLDVSPTALLVIGTVLVALFILALLADTATAWIRSHRGHHH